MTNKTEDRFYFGKPDVMATPMGEHGAIGKLVSRAIQEGAAAYRAGKPAVLNARDPKYKGMSAKELEIYGNFWMRGWDGERIKDASAKPIGRGIDLPGMRFSRPGQPERFAEGGAPIGPSILQKITSALSSGQTVYVSTMTKITKITPKTWKKWEASGRPLFKVNSKGDLMMASGSSYNTLSMGPTMLVGITMRNESSRPGQPERFMRDIPVKSWKKGSEDYEAGITEDSGQFQPYVNMPKTGTLITRNAPTFKSEAGARKWLSEYLKNQGFSRPGQPERFAISSSDLNYAKSQIRAATPQRLREIEQELLPLAKSGDKNAKILLDYLKSEWNERYRGTYSRPGQPDKFDASSLDRGNFAEASKSPMLGKLLSEKAMPDGGWRAVQVGSDTLVISFEDADLARDFGRRAASKGYSATSPVATTGRYWNVEVKNGK